MSLLNMIILVNIGTFAGIYIGAIPGLSVTMAVSLLISLTYSWDIYSSLAVMMGVYVGGVYGGSRSAILLNIPGAPASVATTFDGYPLSKKGQAGDAIAISTIMSVIGGFIGIVLLSLSAPILSQFALKIGSKEYFLIAVIGLTLGANLKLKGILMSIVGIIIGCIGIDSLTGSERLTFGSLYLKGGINYIVAMIGLFSISEALFQVRNLDLNNSDINNNNIANKVLVSKEKIIKYMPCCIKSSFIGTIIGSLPGTGGEIASVIAYDVAKKTTKNPETPFGEGAYEGIVAPESANNAAIGGALIPMLTLGIAGDAVTAVIMGAMQIQGIKVGSGFIDSSGDIFQIIVGLLVVANISLLFFGLTGVKTFTKIIDIPKSILIPLIIVISIIGSYCINNNVLDILVSIIFGVVGYVLRCYNFPVSSIVLGIILSNTIDTNFRRAIIESGSLSSLGIDIVTQPISLGLILILLVTIYSNKKSA